MREALKDWRIYVFGGLFLFNLFFALALAAPLRFPADTIVTIKKGASLDELSGDLAKDDIIRSSLWFRAAVIALGGERGVQAGDYYLKRPQNAALLAWRMVHGEHDLTLVKITIPEGYTVTEIATLFDERFVSLDKDIFIALAPEGYMFPDTYYITVNTTAGQAIELLEDNFKRKIAPLASDIALSGMSEKDVVIMASILEAEVQKPEDKELVSGILWKRLKLGMPLQVDAAPKTYSVPGLPGKPLDNPGLVSIRAALYPKTSPYLYFLSDKNGVIHYAKTLEEHVQNKYKYL